MDTIAAIRSRRSVKHYDPQHQLSEEEITELIDLAMQSPTAFNIQHWRFVVVTDAELRKEIRAVSWDQAQVTDASALVILTANRDAWKSGERYWRDAPKPVQEFLVPAIGQYYEGREQVQRDECFRSMGIAAQTLMLAATAKGYHSCPMDGFDFEAVAKLINLPDSHVIGLFVVIGKGTQDPWPKPGQLPMDEVLIRDRFA